ncbi:MAG: hypothetical protein ABSG73_08940 [Candidatus Aminicenantales bacterium]
MFKFIRDLLKRAKKEGPVKESQATTDSQPAVPTSGSSIDFLENIYSDVPGHVAVVSYPITAPDIISSLRRPLDELGGISPANTEYVGYPSYIGQQAIWPSILAESTVNWWNTVPNAISVKSPIWPSILAESSIDWWSNAPNIVSLKSPFLYGNYESIVPSVIEQISLYENKFENYKKEFINELLYLFETEIFEYGVDNKADTFVAEWLTTNPSLTKEWLNSLYNDYFSNASVLTKILRIICRIEYQVISPQGPTMAALVLNHKNAEVQEAAIRAFESWGSLESLKYLSILRSELKFADKWVRDYVDEVIFYLKEDLNVAPSPED